MTKPLSPVQITGYALAAQRMLDGYAHVLSVETIARLDELSKGVSATVFMTRDDAKWLDQLRVFFDNEIVGGILVSHPLAVSK
jgi:hypothetical protein